MRAGPIARATLQTALVLGLRLVAQAGTLLLVARMLGPAAFGQFAGMAALAVMFGALSSAGLNIQLLAKTSREPERAADLLGPALLTTAVTGGALLLVFLLLTPWLLSQSKTHLLVLLGIGLTEIVLHPLISLPSAIKQAHGRIAHSQLLIMAPYALRLLLAGLVAMSAARQPLTLYALVYPLPSMLTLGVVLRPWLTGPTPVSLRYASAPGELRTALPFAVLNLTAMTPAELDKALASRLLTGSAPGVYSAGARAISAVTLPVIAMMLSALPRLFRAEQEHPQAIRRLLRWLGIATLGYSLVMATALWLFAPMLDDVFGMAYRGLAASVRLLVFAVPGMALRTVAGTALMAIGRPWMRVSFELVGVALLPGLALTLVPLWPAQGMPAALIATESCMAVIGWILLKRSIPVPSKAR